MRHEDVAALVTDYDINNAYQYIIAREETHLSWLQHALLDLGAPLPAIRRAAPALDGEGRRLEVARRRRCARQRAVRREVAPARRERQPTPATRAC